MPRRARRGRRRRQLGRAGGDLLRRLRPAGDDRSTAATSLAKSMSRYLIDTIEATAEHRRPPQRRGGGGPRRRRRSSGSPSATPRPASSRSVALAAMFVFIGARPQTDWLPGGVARDPRGFVLAGAEVLREEVRPRWRLDRDPYLLETSMPGVFVAGDVRSQSMKRVASAVGEGSMAVQLRARVPGGGRMSDGSRCSRSSTSSRASSEPVLEDFAGQGRPERASQVGDDAVHRGQGARALLGGRRGPDRVVALHQRRRRGRERARGRRPTPAPPTCSPATRRSPAAGPSPRCELLTWDSRRSGPSCTTPRPR